MRPGSVADMINKTEQNVPLHSNAVWWFLSFTKQNKTKQNKTKQNKTKRTP